MSRIDLKVVLLGKEYCGKTSLVERFLNDRFAGENRYQNTIGAAYGARTVSVGGKELTLGVWDTAGSERYEAMSRMYYRNAKAAIVCYAVNDEDSWEKVKAWVTELKKHEPSCTIYICATKIDLLKGNNKNRKVDYHNTTDYADEVPAKLMETSSKVGENIFDLFQTIAKDYLESKANSLESYQDYVYLDKPTKLRSCCAKQS
ncbi:ras-related protein Rab-24 [Eurytemora carolleeae]|uniref:ras-related protein Rab-24 n=1 Tax=Eurytemora carolleeae TaxID=1294199 RepID=UPI000C75A6F9|nr:ras-related protein Rab-24 [Eurytemora carolleeae]|eukprot:XP_023338777.1 ras-related protein Rab-24-like [Eurytemora affinis]